MTQTVPSAAQDFWLYTCAERTANAHAFQWHKLQLQRQYKSSGSSQEILQELSLGVGESRHSTRSRTYSVQREVKQLTLLYCYKVLVMYTNARILLSMSDMLSSAGSLARGRDGPGSSILLLATWMVLCSSS